jgi:hypothetical protein
MVLSLNRVSSWIIFCSIGIRNRFFLIADIRPHVYIIDFETATEFDADAKLEDCLISDLPYPRKLYQRI